MDHQWYLANVIRTARLPPLGEVRHIVQYDDGEVESLDLAQERFKVLRVVAPREGGGVPSENPPKAASSLKVVIRGATGGVLAGPGPVLGKRQRRLTPAMAKMKEEQLMKALIKQQKTGGGGEEAEEERDPAVDDSPSSPSPPQRGAPPPGIRSARLASKRGMKKLAMKKQSVALAEAQLPADEMGLSHPLGSTPRKLLRPKRVTRTPRRISSEDFVEFDYGSDELFEEPPPDAPTQTGAELATLADLAGLAAEAQVQPSPSAALEKRAAENRRLGAGAGSSGVSSTVEWLNSGPFREYAPLFVYHQITWEVLPYLTRDDLRDMGLHLVGPRRALLVALHELQKGKKAAPRKARRGFR
jgi:hypothetical protein